MHHRRNRYQRGSLTIARRKTGPDVWSYRWRDSIGNLKTIRRKRIIGTVKDYPTVTAARKALDGFRLDINAEAVSTSQLTIREVAEHFKQFEFGEECGKTVLTREVYTHHLDNCIVPRWGAELIGDVKAFRVEAWLKSLDKADATKAKTKAVFGVPFQHAMRYGWATRNPIREVRQSAKRRRNLMCSRVRKSRRC